MLLARSDAECLVGIAAGEHACFAELLSRFQSRVVNLIYRMVRDWDVALDLGQDTFLRIYQRAASFRPDGNASAWILTVAANAARDHLRSPKNKILHLDRPDTTEESLGASRTTAPGEVLEREETRRIVQDVLSELPEAPRMIILLRDFDSRSYEEIAEIVGCEVGTVKSRLHRARRQFEVLYNRRRGSHES